MQHARLVHCDSDGQSFPAEEVERGHHVQNCPGFIVLSCKDMLKLQIAAKVHVAFFPEQEAGRWGPRWSRKLYCLRARSLLRVELGVFCPRCCEVLRVENWTCVVRMA